MKHGNMAETSHTNNHHGKSDHIMELLRIIRGENTDPPLGRAFSYQYNWTTTTHDRVTKLSVSSKEEWDVLMQQGIVWENIQKLVEERDCIQIGSLYLSRRILQRSTFQEVFSLGHFCRIISIIRESAELSTDLDMDLCESALKGLMKMYGATCNEISCCNVPLTHESQDVPWPLICDWGVILDKVMFYRSMGCCDDPAHLKWIARHFRTVDFASNHNVTKSMLHRLLADTTSNVWRLAGLQLNETGVGGLSEAIQNSCKIRSLEVHLDPDVNKGQQDTLIRALCECNTLIKLNLCYLQRVSPQDFTNDLISLIRCGHIEDIEYYAWNICYHEVRDLSSDEREGLRAARTQSILDAIEGSPRFLVFRDTGYGNYANAFNIGPIQSAIELRQVKEMLHMLETNTPNKMALFGNMVCRLGRCKAESKRMRSIGMLFHLLCETSNAVAQQCRHPTYVA